MMRVKLVNIGIFAVYACLTLHQLSFLKRSGGHDELILYIHDLEMGSADDERSKLHPADRIPGRRSGGQIVPKGLGLVGRDARQVPQKTSEGQSPD